MPVFPSPLGDAIAPTLDRIAALHRGLLHEAVDAAVERGILSRAEAEATSPLGAPSPAADVQVVRA
jgi:hypothetical protein